VVAEIAQNLGALVVGVVTTPFSFDGARRRQTALCGSERLVGKVGTVLTLQNEGLQGAVEQRTSIEAAFERVDEACCQAILALVQPLASTALGPLEFAVLREMLVKGGAAVVALARGGGIPATFEALRQALSHPLTGTPIDRVSTVLVSVAGGPSLSRETAHEMAGFVRWAAPHAGNLLLAAVREPNGGAETKVTAIGTGVVGDRPPRGPTSVPAWPQKPLPPLFRAELARPRLPADRY
jgi:cell division protein FtsZ